MKTFKFNLTENPSFNTVVGLSNKTFDPINFVSGRGATEDQLKFVHDLIAALQEWLDENGCSDDPYAIIRQRVTELEQAIDECCNNPQDSIIQELRDRLDALENYECPDQSSFSTECDGNVITVSFGWTGEGTGKATAVSADPNKSIAGYFLLLQTSPGVFVKVSSASGYSIDGEGNVRRTTTGSSGGTVVGLIVGVGATDTSGCEGITSAAFPLNFQPIIVP